MSDNIPLEIQVEIFKRLPIKLLIQLRSVSKTWKSLIDSSDFIAHYSAQHTQPQHLLVDCYDPDEHHFVSFADDDDTFSQLKVCLTIPRLLDWLKCYRIIGCSHGLMYLYADCQEGCGGHNSQTGMAVLWNPSIRKAVAVIVPKVEYGMYETVVGFGVCCETMDLKIVRIRYIDKWEDMENISCIPSQVEVFTLSTGAWRSPYSNLPRKSIKFGWQRQEVVDRFLYWLATDKITTDGGFRSYNLIVSFNMTSEEFKEVKLPDSLALAVHPHPILHISKLRNSLVVLETERDANNPAVAVWMMEDDVPKSFTKLFTINSPDTLVMGFRNNGAPIVEITEWEDHWRVIVVYEPYSKHIDDLGGGHIYCSHFVFPYMETLLLLDQPDNMVYNDISM